MRERGEFLSEITSLLSRHGWSRKWPDLPAPRGNSSEEAPKQGIFDIMFTRPLFLDHGWWDVAAHVECKADRGTGRISWDEIHPNQRRWAAWRSEQSIGFSGWIAFVMGKRRAHPTQPIRAFFVTWDFWQYIEGHLSRERQSLSYQDACERFGDPETELVPHNVKLPSGRIKYGWEFPAEHLFLAKFRLVPIEPIQVQPPIGI